MTATAHGRRTLQVLTESGRGRGGRSGLGGLGRASWSWAAVVIRPKGAGGTDVWRSRNASYRLLGPDFTAWHATSQAQKTSALITWTECSAVVMISLQWHAVVVGLRDKEETSVGQPGELVATARGTGSSPRLSSDFLFAAAATERYVGNLRSPSGRELRWKSPPSVSLHHGAQSFSSRVSARRSLHGFLEVANDHLVAQLIAGVARCSNGKRREGLLEDAKNQQTSGNFRAGRGGSRLFCARCCPPYLL